MTRVFDSELAARRYMQYLAAQGIRYSYWHVSVCRHEVTS
jgi:hypothetical protein